MFDFVFVWPCVERKGASTGSIQVTKTEANVDLFIFCDVYRQYGVSTRLKQTNTGPWTETRANVRSVQRFLVIVTDLKAGRVTSRWPTTMGHMRTRSLEDERNLRTAVGGSAGRDLPLSIKRPRSSIFLPFFFTM